MTQTRVESIQGRLRRFVAKQRLRPGDRLPSEPDLAGELGVNRLTLREGLRSLEALGLIESRAGSGWYVRPFHVSTAADAMAHTLAFHPQVVMDLLQMRRWMEPDVAAQVAGRLSPGDLETLDELVDRMRWRASRRQAFAAEDRAFHRLLFAASGNLVAVAVVDLYFRVHEALSQSGFPGARPSRLEEIAEQHAAIVEALRLGDGAEASRLLREEHYGEAVPRLTEWLAEHTGAVARAGTGDGALPATLAESGIQNTIQSALLVPHGGADRASN